jgi:hypothetical protein
VGWEALASAVLLLPLLLLLTLNMAVHTGQALQEGLETAV